MTIAKNSRIAATETADMNNRGTTNPGHPPIGRPNIRIFEVNIQEYTTSLVMGSAGIIVSIRLWYIVTESVLNCCLVYEGQKLME